MAKRRSAEGSDRVGVGGRCVGRRLGSSTRVPRVAAVHRRGAAPPPREREGNPRRARGQVGEEEPERRRESRERARGEKGEGFLRWKNVLAHRRPQEGTLPGIGGRLSQEVLSQSIDGDYGTKGTSIFFLYESRTDLLSRHD